MEDAANNRDAAEETNRADFRQGLAQALRTHIRNLGWEQRNAGKRTDRAIAQKLIARIIAAADEGDENNWIAFSRVRIGNKRYYELHLCDVTAHKFIYLPKMLITRVPRIESIAFVGGRIRDVGQSTEFVQSFCEALSDNTSIKCLELKADPLLPREESNFAIFNHILKAYSRPRRDYLQLNIKNLNQCLKGL
mmetsp:Transcript_16846/g.31508  ORF Transcript_16846/g.31508 Transcript_16846/m.31508 type:complete len:193 (-) Transcript_16846:389-967(-)